jgi:hypothetical protein
LQSAYLIALQSRQLDSFSLSLGQVNLSQDVMKAVYALSALILLVSCQPQRQKPNRYQIITEGPVMLKLDTETGQTWRWVTDYTGNGGTWKAVQTEP